MQLSLCTPNRSKALHLECDCETSPVKLPVSSWRGPVTVHCNIPYAGIAGFWQPQMNRPRQQLLWDYQFNSSFQCGLPFFSMFSTENINRFSIGFSNAVSTMEFRIRMNQELGCAELTVDFVAQEDFVIFIDTVPSRTWMEVLRDYCCFLHPSPLVPAPDAAWNPVFCTWYAAHAELDTRWTEENAALAAKLGFGTFIIDDGWCFDEKKRVSPSTVSTWYEHIGDWEVSMVKFPDFHSHVKRVKEMGLTYMVWVAPFLVGCRSRLADRVATAGNDPCGFARLDPNDSAGMRLVLNQVLKLAEKYELDGLKVDFIDTLPPCEVPDAGKYIYNFVRELAEKLRAHNPEALIEFRQNYSTIMTAGYATQFRANDTPFDFMENFNRIVQLRLLLGDGVPIHSDPVFWNRNAEEEEIARHLVAALAGVPMASLDLTTLTGTEEAIFRNYLAFYRTHRDFYQFGKWKIFAEQDCYAGIVAEYHGRRLAIAAQRAFAFDYATTHPAELVLLNLTGTSLHLPNLKRVWNGKGEEIPSASGIPVGGRGEF